MLTSRVLGLLVLLAAPALAQPPQVLLAHLHRGVSITGWFRFPASRDPAALARWMPDSAMAGLRRAGFDFVRLAIDPAVAETAAVRDVATAAICRLRKHDLAVVVDAHPVDWHLETDPRDRDRLRAFWRAFAPTLRRCDPQLIVPEVLNEPVFPNDPAGWAALQHTLLTDLREALPDSTILLTGQDWGSIRGLLALTPEADTNVLYSFHFYDPPELTSLAAYRPDLNRADLARLPFPVISPAACPLASDGATADTMHYYCAMAWNGAAIEQRIAAAADWAKQHHATLLAGEFGAVQALNSPARSAWLRTVRQSLEHAGIAWALWGYDDIMGFGIPRPPPATPILDPNVLVALGLPPS